MLSSLYLLHGKKRYRNHYASSAMVHHCHFFLFKPLLNAALKISLILRSVMGLTVEIRTLGLISTTFNFHLSLNLMSTAVLAYFTVSALKELCARFSL